MEPRAPRPAVRPPSRREVNTRRAITGAGWVLGVALVVLGLAVVGVFVLFIVGTNNFGSDK